jgi:hypothetical protein
MRVERAAARKSVEQFKSSDKGVAGFVHTKIGAKLRIGFLCENAALQVKQRDLVSQSPLGNLISTK